MAQLILVFALSWLITVLLADPVAAMLTPGLRAENYRGETIPTAMGIVMLLAVLGAAGGLGLTGLISPQPGLPLFWLTLVSLAGLLDDAAGSHSCRGFRGHIAALFQGRFTSGMAKVFIIGGGAIVLSAPFRGQGLIKLGVLVLTVNLFNQLDLRPGRALKVFLILAVLLARGGHFLLSAGAGSALGLLPGDLRAKYMLGDTGANLLGALAGLALITSVSETWLVISLVLLVLGNGAGELFSFSRLIAASSALSWLDQLGRQEGD